MHPVSSNKTLLLKRWNFSSVHILHRPPSHPYDPTETETYQWVKGSQQVPASYGTDRSKWPLCDSQWLPINFYSNYDMQGNLKEYQQHCMNLHISIHSKFIPTHTTYTQAFSQAGFLSRLWFKFWLHSTLVSQGSHLSRCRADATPATSTDSLGHMLLHLTAPNLSPTPRPSCSGGLLVGPLCSANPHHQWACPCNTQTCISL